MLHANVPTVHMNACHYLHVQSCGHAIMPLKILYKHAIWSYNIQHANMLAVHV